MGRTRVSENPNLEKKMFVFFTGRGGVGWGLK